MINKIAIILGISSIIIGFLKLFSGFDSYTISIGGSYATIPNSSSLFYIIMINFIGGISVCYHSFKTRRFKKENTNSESLKLTQLELLTGIYSLIIALIMLVKLFVLLSGFSSNWYNFFMVMIIVTIIQAFYPFIIILVVSSNFTRYRAKKNQKMNL